MLLATQLYRILTHHHRLLPALLPHYPTMSKRPSKANTSSNSPAGCARAVPLSIVDPYKARPDFTPVPDRGSTAVYYSEQHTTHRALTSDEGTIHPENPTRTRFAWLKLRSDRIRRILANRLADDAEIKLVHTAPYVELIGALSSQTEAQRADAAARFNSVYLSADSDRVARLAVGTVLQLVENVVLGEQRNGFALTRPPGHHATPSSAMGYCIFNSVAIAARYAIEQLGLTRVLIVDWDVHHGNGTQEVFYEDERVCHVSIHRYQERKYWPHSSEAAPDRIGQGVGAGYNVNVALGDSGLGFSDYFDVFHNLVLPIAFEYSPQLVLVSAGFDSARGDPKGEMDLPPAAYGHFVHWLEALADGKICLVLEGGYDPFVTSECVNACVDVLSGAAPTPLAADTATRASSTDECIAQTVQCLKPYWSSLTLYNALPVSGVVDSSTLAEYSETDCEGAPHCDGHWNADDELKVTQAEALMENDEGTSLTDLVQSVDNSNDDYRTAVAYHESMLRHEDRGGTHPECPERLVCINRALTRHKLWPRCLPIGVDDDVAPSASNEQLRLFHPQAYIDDLHSTAAMSPRDLEHYERRLNSVYLCASTHSAARTSAALLLDVVDRVMKRHVRNAFAVIRPPGHHAESATAMGFCFFNNVVLAALHARQRFGAKRILIVDWDVHHGNGIQEAFYRNPNFLYISLHMLHLYPGKNHTAHLVGQGDGRGFNVNIPWSHHADSGERGDGAYLQAFLQVVMPMAYQFNPDLVLVSCGFDSALDDPLGSCQLTPVGFALMTHQLAALAEGRLVLALEGGYNTEVMGGCASACVAALLGDCIGRLPAAGVVPQDAAFADIASARRHLADVVRYDDLSWRFPGV